MLGRSGGTVESIWGSLWWETDILTCREASNRLVRVTPALVGRSSQGRFLFQQHRLDHRFQSPKMPAHKCFEILRQDRMLRSLAIDEFAVSQDPPQCREVPQIDEHSRAALEARIGLEILLVAMRYASNCGSAKWSRADSLWKVADTTSARWRGRVVPVVWQFQCHAGRCHHASGGVPAHGNRCAVEIDRSQTRPATPWSPVRPPHPPARRWAPAGSGRRGCGRGCQCGRSRSCGATRGTVRNCSANGGAVGWVMDVVLPGRRLAGPGSVVVPGDFDPDLDRLDLA